MDDAISYVRRNVVKLTYRLRPFIWPD